MHYDIAQFVEFAERAQLQNAVECVFKQTYQSLQTFATQTFEMNLLRKNIARLNNRVLKCQMQ
jgi:hypothetical protein